MSFRTVTLAPTAQGRRRVAIRNACLAATWSAVLAGAPNAVATPGVIALQITASARHQDTTSEVDVTVANVGDEPAESLQVHVDFDGLRRSGVVAPRLPANDTREETIRFVTPGILPGRHPMIIIVEYTDANGYPLSAVSYATLIVAKDRPPTLGSSLESIELFETGEMALRVTNLGEQAREVEARLVLPRELAFDPGGTSFALDRLESHTEVIRVRNHAALSGSTYPVFALLEYQEDGQNACVFVPATITVVDNQPNSIDLRLIVLVAALSLLLGIVLLQLRDKTQRTE